MNKGTTNSLSNSGGWFCQKIVQCKFRIGTSASIKIQRKKTTSERKRVKSKTEGPTDERACEVGQNHPGCHNNGRSETFRGKKKGINFKNK